MSDVSRRRFVLASAVLSLAVSNPRQSFAGSDTQAAERTPFTAEEIAAARPLGLDARLRIPGDDAAAFQALIDAAPAAGDPWLVLSGGGAGGAFGAGLLAGWSAAGDRPAFGIVTGVSTGALMAPFAFLGQPGDAPLREIYTQTTAADVFEYGTTAMSLTDPWPLKRRIDRMVTPALLKGIAAEHARGRRLLIATTEIDTGRPVLWDMGALAGLPGESPLALFRSILMASAAVPGLFPPVAIAARLPGKTIEELHVDGGTTGPFFLVPKPALTGAEPVRIAARTVYLVINNGLRASFSVAQRTTLSVLGQSLSAAIRAQTEDNLALARAFAGRAGFDLKVATIDGSVGESSTPFDQRYMRALYDHGEGLGRARTAFSRSAEGPAAPAVAGR